MADKFYWFLGYNNLSLLLKQERKHWLLKTDKKKQIQDDVTGDMYQGELDNLGTDIILETQKLPIKSVNFDMIKFDDEMVDKVLNVASSAFTYSSQVNGLMFSRIISTSYPLKVGNDTEYKNYKLKLVNCEECVIPFGGGLSNPEVYCDKWLKTTTPPSLLMLGNDGLFTIEKQIEFNNDITGCVYYYPLTESIQPVGISNEGNGTYISELIDSDGYIGYPLYWFCCDQTNVGPTLCIDEECENVDMFLVGNEGNASKYNAKLFFDYQTNKTPDETASDNYVIKCSTNDSFDDSSNDFGVSIDVESISLYNTTTSTNYPLGILTTNIEKVTMTENDGWEYVDSTHYQIPLNLFDNNRFDVNAEFLNTVDEQNLIPMISAFDVQFDESISFENTTTDVGYAGIRMSSSNLTSDVYDRYPHELNEWDGLPTWFEDMDDGVPQHMSIYAIHNTPTYVESIPESRQVAGILLDPGKYKEDEEEDLTNDERGRAYVISNDSIEYKNNETCDFKKPARTVARICDIPVSVMQLSGITNLSPTSIVDKRYVRTEGSYSLADKDRLYNTLADRWVKPTALDKDSNPITEQTDQTNSFVFSSPVLLNKVDMYDHNDFRKYENLNSMVDPTKVSLSSITSRGDGYAVDDIGIVVVGGFGFNYIVTEVNEAGGVMDLLVTPSDSSFNINLSNFDMVDGDDGISLEYGTSPLTGNGGGLCFRFGIEDYASLLPYKGDCYDGLYAFVRLSDGIWLYEYKTDERSLSIPKESKWFSSVLVSEFEQSTPAYGLSTKDSYMNSIIPKRCELDVAYSLYGKERTTLDVYKTASFINIIDKTKTPVIDGEKTTMNVVDLNKFCTDGILRLTAGAKTIDYVKRAIENNNAMRYDSYVCWRWVDTASTNTTFEYFVIYRSFNNLLSTDHTTTLPKNELNCDNYVHSNESTNLVWDVEDIGNMMWVYNPTMDKKEKYYIDYETRELYVDRDELTWDDIDMFTADKTKQKYSLFVDNKLAWNVMSNSPMHSTLESSPIYQQPKLVQLNDMMIGNSRKDIVHKPIGGWQLIFPQLENFKLINGDKYQSLAPTRMVVVKDRNIGNSDEVVDTFGNNINKKTIVLHEDVDGIKLKAFNTMTGSWESL